MLQKHIHQLAWEDLSHNPKIKKRVFLRNGDVAHVTQFAQSRFEPGQSAPSHSHVDMVEVFLVTSGTATAVVDGKTVVLPPGSCLVLHPGEEHELRNDYDDDLVLTYFGIRQ